MFGVYFTGFGCGIVVSYIVYAQVFTGVDVDENETVRDVGHGVRGIFSNLRGVIRSPVVIRSNLILTEEIPRGHGK